MQEFKHDELIRTLSGDNPEALAAQISDESTHAVIGKLPCRGSVVEINGLKYVVLSKSDKKGTLHLEIMKPKVNDG